MSMGTIGGSAAERITGAVAGHRDELEEDDGMRIGMRVYCR